MNLSSQKDKKIKKIYVLPPGENWVVDRFFKEWNCYSGSIRCDNPNETDVVWLLADWAWKNIFNKISYSDLSKKIVVTTIHHIVPEKFSQLEIQDFLVRDQITSVYHVYNQRTFDFVSSLTKKPIKMIRYWANDVLWNKNISKEEARNSLGLNLNSFIIGSFQRDTEGKDLVSPKLEKGPDIFCEFVEEFCKNRNDVVVLLGGWRRQYVIRRLEKSGISFVYKERPEDAVVNEMYRSLDLYVVSARCEGGPQSLIECGLTGVPCISTPVGIAEQVLNPDSINNNLSLTMPSIPNVDHMKMRDVMSDYLSFFNSL